MVEGISGGDYNVCRPEYFVHNHLYFKFKDGLWGSIMDHSLWTLFSFVNLWIVKILLLSTLYRVMWFCSDGNHTCEDWVESHWNFSQILLRKVVTWSTFINASICVERVHVDSILWNWSKWPPHLLPCNTQSLEKIVNALESQSAFTSS